METNTDTEGISGIPVAGNGPAITAVPKALRQRVSQLIEGIQAGLPDGSSLPIAGQTITKDDLVKGLTQIVGLYQAIDASVANTETLRQQLRSQLPALHRQVVGVKDALVAHLGRGTPQLAHYGIKASMGSNPLTPDQKVVRAAKAKKTRELRHTLGKRQKAAIRYDGKLELKVSSGQETNAGETPSADGPGSSNQEDALERGALLRRSRVASSHYVLFVHHSSVT